MATTNIRWAACQRIVSLLQSDNTLTGVTVEPGWPGDRAPTARLIWIDELDGTCEIPVMTGGRKQRNDDFDIPLQIRVIGLGTLDDTMGQLSVLVAAVENALANSTTLEDLDGVLSAEITRERMTSAMFPEGPVGFAEVVVSVSTRLL